MSGTVADSYTGATTVSNGKLILAKSAGVLAIPGNVTINTPSSTSSYLVLNATGQIPTSAVMTFSPNSSAYGYFELYGNSQTLAGISDTTGRGVIENTELETGLAAGSTLTLNNSADCSFNGYIRNYSSGSTGLLALVKNGADKLTLSGVNCGGFSGGLTVTGGTLDYSNGTLPGLANSVYCPYTVNGGTLNIGTKTASIGTFQITTGAVNGAGTLTSNAAYDIQGGTVNAVLAGSVGLNKTNASGTATVNAPTYTGTTTVTAGTLNFTGGLPGGNYVVNGGTLDIDSLTKSIGAFQITSGTVSGAGALTSNATYDIQAGAVNAVLAGSGIALTKSGTGTATLNAADTYSGATTVSLGTLALGASGTFVNSPTINIASTAVLDLTAKASTFSFGAGQTLKGYGTINIGSGKTINLAGGGTLAPGGSIGTLNVTGNLDLTGGTAAFELGTPGASHAAVGTER